MKSAYFEYYKPKNIASAIDKISDSCGEKKLISGGQSLSPMLNLRLVRPKLLVDISRITELKKIENNHNYIRIGAAVTHAEIEDHNFDGLRILSDVARGIAYRTIRNRGTIGGSLAHADPAGDWPLVLPALGATIFVSGPRGERRILASEFMERAFTTKLNDNEIITAIQIPKLSAMARWGYWKFCRKMGEFPDASAAMLLDSERKIAELWIGALDGSPKPLNRFARELAVNGLKAFEHGIQIDELALNTPGLGPMRHQLLNTAIKRAVAKGFN